MRTSPMIAHKSSPQFVWVSPTTSRHQASRALPSLHPIASNSHGMHGNHNSTQFAEDHALSKDKTGFSDADLGTTDIFVNGFFLPALLDPNRDSRRNPGTRNQEKTNSASSKTVKVPR